MKTTILLPKLPPTKADVEKSLRAICLAAFNPKLSKAQAAKVVAENEPTLKAYAETLIARN